MKATDKNPEQVIEDPASVRQSDRRHQSQIVNPKSEIEPHPLKQWIDFWKISTGDLSKATRSIAPPGLHDSFIRYICRDEGVASRKSVLKLSKTTGIPPEILMFPERFPDFNPEEYKPDLIKQSVSC